MPSTFNDDGFSDCGETCEGCNYCSPGWCALRDERHDGTRCLDFDDEPDNSDEIAAAESRVGWGVSQARGG